MKLTHNTQEKLPAATPRQIVWLVAGVVLFLLVLNAAAVVAFSRWSYNESYWLMHFKWRQLLATGKLDWLVLGDSAGSSGIDAGLLSAELGPSYNFCIFGDALSKNDLDMLKVYVERHGAPRGVILVHTYDVWHREANPRVVAHTPIPLSQVAAEYATGTASRPKFVLRCALERWLPLYAQPTSFRQFVRQPQALFAPRLPVDRYGFQADTEARPEALERAMAEAVEFATANRLRVSAVNDSALHEICELAERHAFDIYFTLCPIYEGALAHPAIRAYYDDVVRYLAGFERHSPRFHLLGPLPVTETAERMVNVDHLLAPAARDFTRLVIERIRQVRPGDATKPSDRLAAGMGTVAEPRP